MQGFLHYTGLGFEHVIPLGYDHILFIIALFFFNSNLKTAVIQCSLFTVAHSVTLASAALGFIRFNTGIIETVIALSIFLVAIENMFGRSLRSWRLVLVFLFGLVHGMGFANALQEIGLPQSQMIQALLGFNLGVELAQVSIILGCYFIIAIWIREKRWYQSHVVNPVSVAISSVALFLAIQRFLSL